MSQFLDKNGAQVLADKINAVKAVADGAKTTADNAMPRSGGTMKGELRVNGGDAVGVSKIVLETDKGQITNSSTGTLFGYTGANLLSVGHSTAKLQLRGSGTRPTYNGSDIALLSDANSKYTKPSGGIPKSDLDSTVQASLGKADTALQSHQSLSNYYTKSQTDAAISAAISSSGGGSTGKTLYRHCIIIQILSGSLGGLVCTTIYTPDPYEITSNTALFIATRDSTTSAYPLQFSGAFADGAIPVYGHVLVTATLTIDCISVKSGTSKIVEKKFSKDQCTFKDYVMEFGSKYEA